jgi:murein DD-endopeptidase MepM/ murein hydrolase activator NlpD
MSKAGRKKFFHKIRHKYRLVILREDSLEEKASFRLSRMNVLMMVSGLTVLLSSFVFLLIAYTPLKIYVPGYADYDMRKDIIKLSLQTDSLQKQIDLRDKYVENFKKIIIGDVGEYAKGPDNIIDSIDPTNSPDLFKVSKEDSALRQEFENADQYNLLYQEEIKNEDPLKNIAFFPPVAGLITERFDRNKGHFAIDFATSPHVGVKATLDGTVIEASWNINTGYVIILQHKDNLISIYKHNSALLQKVGKFVRAGEVIAIVGDTGEMSSGPHLHFELWLDGQPLNPEEYIAF